MIPSFTSAPKSDKAFVQSLQWEQEQDSKSQNPTERDKASPPKRNQLAGLALVKAGKERLSMQGCVIVTRLLNSEGQKLE